MTADPWCYTRGMVGMGGTQRSLVASSLFTLGLLTLAGSAYAIVTEPDGRLVPQPLTEDITQAVVDCCGVAADGSNMSLEALFASRSESIHWQADASVEPQYFSPLCGFRGSLILRGGGCQIDFGWYNVDLNNPNPPAQIIPLVTTADVANWFTENGYPPNNNNAFHPAVGERPIQGAPIQDIRANPNYAGGLIGLATLGNDLGGVCLQTHYSEPRLNQMSTYGAPWIMSVVFRSTATPNAFYLGFEDLPTDPDNFQKLTPQGYQNDGDFNDFVYFVEGVTCEGGGQPCLGSAEGACGYGLMECQPDGSVACVPQQQSSPEVCDNIDNDCDGLVDEDDEGSLCPQYEVCDKGVCRGSCSGGEFECIGGLQCETATGLCVDPLCIGVTCDASQVCIGGQCVGGCEGAVCPWGQICQLGRCVDPCRNRTCPSADQVCEDGICVQRCECRPCGAGLDCDAVTGACEPPQCAGVTCPANEVCLAGGVCQNRCNNVLCPGGADCDPATGECNPPLGEPPQMVDYTLEMLSDGGLRRHWNDGRPDEEVVLLPDGGFDVVAVLGPDAGSEPSHGDLGAGEPGCGCRTSGGPSSSAWLSGLLLLAAAIGRNRRRFRR